MAFIAVLVVLIGVRMIEIDLNWSGLSDTTSEFRASVRRIQRGSTVFVAYADRSSGGDDVRDLGLVHAACIAMIERSSLVTTAFTVVGKQVLHVRPGYRHTSIPRTARRLRCPSFWSRPQYDNPIADMPEYWRNWTRFDYLYVLFTEDEAPNPDPSRLRLVVEGDRFQLYRIVKPQDARLNP